ncbi:MULTISPECIES: hypothetical protein [unclassified Coleofasciculus]|uniref:hypothetical protein n=1 Tax=unclassified Coleofasciculus TaxID=2692782 RepID=UPI001880B2DB|nr:MULTISPECIES: hypothetical protein [unclassified Coleofasciculus]MBE9127288.1 hypothetical protein [Coleofasciculus sp. LEGE 07081]MBE9150560.1 hypothetical protein [Coleofasciculus sp. LEGE 07092]
MRVLIVSFLVLFSLLELSHWVEHFIMPLPLLILGGALLAIASNYGKSSGWSLSQEKTDSDTRQLQTPTVNSVTSAPNWTNLQASSSMPVSKSTPSISFTIRPPTSDGVKSEKI